MAQKPDKSSKLTPTRNRRPSLRALATKVGVSHTAVARALRNDHRVSASLCKKVQHIAQQEGYLASDLTRTLITGRSGTVGLVVPTMISPFISAIVDHAASALWEQDVMPFVLCSELDLQTEERMLERLAAKRVDGVIVMPSREDRGQTHFAQLLEQHTPIVTLDNRLPALDLPLVASDDDLGGERVTRHLLEQGHRHILHLGAALDNDQAERRREMGYARVMHEAGLTPRTIHAADRLPQMTAIADLLAAFFDSKAGRSVTAVFCFNDVLAYGVYLYARRQGIRLGQDLAVVGYGNERKVTPGAADPVDLLEPTLSTVDQHPDRIAREAVDLLQRMIAEESVPRQVLIEPELMVRDSSAARLG